MQYLSKISFLIPLACMPLTLQAQTDLFSHGARASGMGNATTVLKDPWAAVNNIAGIAGIQKISFASTFETRFGLSSLNSGTFIAVAPVRKVGIGLSLSRFGDELYNEQAIGLGAAHTIHQVSLGLKCSYFQVCAPEMSTKSAVILEFGGQIEVTKQLSFGAHLYNASISSLRIGGDKVPLPMVMKAGLGYAPHKKLLLTVETFKELAYKASFRGGLEYAVIEKLKFRTGISTHPLVNHFGVGFRHLSFSADYAFSVQTVLGAVNQFTVAYQLKSR